MGTELLTAFTQWDTWVSLLSLTMLEIVLGIDNVVFISIVSSRLPAEQQAKARRLGLILAFVFRVALLFAITWVMGLVKPLVTLGALSFSGRDLIFLLGGFFLVAKSTKEIHANMEEAGHGEPRPTTGQFWSVVGQIVLLDIVFSFDSVVTAVGLVDTVLVMVLAVMISLGVMLAFAGKISAFIHKHPTLKMLALSFLIMIGTMLIAEGFHFHVPRGYIYVSMAFSLLVEALNLRVRAKQEKAKAR